MNLTEENAKEYAIMKWQYIVDNNGSREGLLEKYPVLKELKANCSYCELYVCDNCPIGTMGDCTSGSHPWCRWKNLETKENAQKVLDLILNS